MIAPTIPVSTEENLGDLIEIRVDIVHPAPVAVHLIGVPIQEELTALRFRVYIAEEENASLRATIRTMEVIETVTRNHERHARIEIEREIKKLEIELWNLKVKGTDVASYTQRFQELAQMCERMFPEKSDEVEKYVGGLLDNIQGSVMTSKPKTMQDAIEITNELMDQKAADRVVALTPSSTITIPETANELAIKDTETEAVRLMMFPLSLTGEAKTWLDELNEVTIKT
ncbi:hypothetical protein Tco_0719459 [Tanacetum coccineum]